MICFLQYELALRLSELALAQGYYGLSLFLQRPPAESR